MDKNEVECLACPISMVCAADIRYMSNYCNTALTALAARSTSVCSDDVCAYCQLQNTQNCPSQQKEWGCVDSMYFKGRMLYS